MRGTRVFSRAQGSKWPIFGVSFLKETGTVLCRALYQVQPFSHRQSSATWQPLRLGACDKQAIQGHRRGRGIGINSGKFINSEIILIGDGTGIFWGNQFGGVPTTLILLQKYRDTNWRHIVIQIGGAYTLSAKRRAYFAKVSR